MLLYCTVLYCCGMLIGLWRASPVSLHLPAAPHVSYTVTCAVAGEVDRAALLRRSERAERPRLTDMARDFGLLAAELERVYGEQRLLPSRAQLRAAQRGDLDKARACPCMATTRFNGRGCLAGTIKCVGCGHALSKLLQEFICILAGTMECL